jgi:hypothetical protein
VQASNERGDQGRWSSAMHAVTRVRRLLAAIDDRLHRVNANLRRIARALTELAIFESNGGFREGHRSEFGPLCDVRQANMRD